MLLLDLVSWWYSRGWKWAGEQLFVAQTQKILGFFSVGDLLKTLFSPFRQDVIDTRRAPLSLKLQAFGGNIISRIFGLIIRSALIIIGLLLIALNALAGIIATLIWPLVPVMPIVAMVLLLNGARR